MLKFSEIPYSRPDVEAVKQELEAIIAAFSAADAYDAARAQFIASDRLMRHVATALSLIHI